MFNKRSFIGGLIGLFLLIPNLGWAQSLFLVRAEIAVYGAPDHDASIMHSLTEGDQVRLSKKETSGFRAVLYREGAQEKRGYILVKDVEFLERTNVQTKKSITQPMEFSNLKRAGFYFSGVYSFQYQGKRELQTTADSIYEVSEFTGATLYFGGGYEYRYDENWSLRAGLVRREVRMKGDASTKGVSGTQNEFELSESFIGGEVGLKYSPPDWGRYSFLLAFEYSAGTDIKLEVLSGAPVLSDGLEKPTFGVLYGALAARYPLAKNWSVEPAVRGGVVFTTDPVTILAEASGSMIYYY